MSVSPFALGRVFRARPKRGPRLLGLAVVCLALVALGSPAGASAAPPSNDNFTNATIVAGLPFSDSVDISEATTEPGEPVSCGTVQSVWYSFTPSSDVVVRASTAGSGFSSTSVNAYRADGPGLGGLTWLACGQFGQDVVFQAHAGTTYYVLGGSSFFSNTGTLAFHLTAVPPPPNNDFANAIPFSNVPFTDTQDITGATTEPGEPLPICGGQFVTTTWYAFTPATSGTYSASAGGAINGAGVNIYTGSSLGNLTQVACGSSATGLGTWHANAGTTYYIQAGSWFQTGQLTLNVDLAPPPAVGFIWGPGDPSIFDSVQFFDISFDPAGVGIQIRSWDFGDGKTGTGQQVNHQFAKDGEYTVKLTDTTTDGRSNSATNVIHVMTHDVAIVNLAVPNSSRAGRTAQITVKLSNTRYPENVQVVLFRSSSTGFDQVASVTEAVPKMGRNQTLSVKLIYTFTAADAAAGKVTFKASAALLGVRDALPGDNDAIAPPTKVTP